MSYFGPAGYEDDWDDDQFDFGDHYDPEYSAHNSYPATKFSESTTNVKSQQKNDAAQNPSLKTSRFNGGFGSPSDLKSTVNMGTAGRGRGKGGFSETKSQNNGKTNSSEVKKSKGQGNFLFLRAKDKAKKNSDEKNSQIAEDFRAAIVNGDLGVIHNILDKGISVDCILKSGWTGLMHAASCGLPEMVTVLTERGANVNFQKDMFSVVMAACSSDSDAEDGVAECLSILIEKGAKINSHDRYHMTPLMYACRNGRQKIVEILLRHKPDVNKQDQRGWTALGWAASRGKGRIVRMLLDENANPRLYTNDGQSAEDLAYDGGFTVVADVLNSIVNPGRRIEQASQNNTGSEIRHGEKSDCVRYGDLELFLFGLELGHLVPLFQDHKITFDGFLQLTDAELQQIGISQIGIRKKILTATHDVHTKEWDLSSLPSEATNQITSDDLKLVLANVEKHLQYIKCSIGYVTKSLVGAAGPTTIIQDTEHCRQFLARTEDVLTEVNGISGEILRLQCSVEEISSGVPNVAADLISKNLDKDRKQNKLTNIHILIVAGCLGLGLTAALILNGTSRT
ncbi:ankyrin repeat, SAM and basic leucine zipper domain-containing protein 1-like [Dendronephthya gigantea]|uniref:ankyrin repeat, SAM and basic leucine zipper domain-containing protein 1-like n=1 Tax=Dendronephthya gigantea TaxID=151771 RepID=UPI0010698BED|nr:ankyrin repeat, SAM and basic leucine zipper domain-containing protein 1-like [Dendronephthya gigantea]